MIDKLVGSTDLAVADIADGQTILIGGFGESGLPADLIDALIRRRLKALTVVSNNSGSGDGAMSRLMASGSVSRLVCSFPRGNPPGYFQRCYPEHGIALELCPQGTLAERIRAGGAGIGGFYTRTAVGTDLAEGKEVRRIGDEDYVLEYPISGDVALISGRQADRWGNTLYDKAGRNMGPIMAMAATTAIVQVREVVPLGSIDPEAVITPGLFVQRVVEVRIP
jgi:3-oxoadipate CoA-transferase alpha subunit